MPEDIDLDCFAQLQVRSSGEVSNTATLSIAAAGETACSSPDFTTELLRKLDAGGTIIRGLLVAGKTSYSSTSLSATGAATTISGKSESITGLFGKFTAAAIAEINGGWHVDGCTIYRKTALSGSTGIGSPFALADAGSSLALTGPGLAANAAMPRIPVNTDALTLAASTLQSGVYTVTGSGGTEIGAFQASVAMPASFTPINFDALTNMRSQQAADFDLDRRL